MERLHWLFVTGDADHNRLRQQRIDRRHPARLIDPRFDDVRIAPPVIRQPLRLVLQVLVSRYNEHQVSAIKKFARRMGASIKLKSMQITDGMNCLSWLPSERKFRRYEMQNDEYVIRGHLPDYCARLWFSPVVSWDGRVLPCCFDKDAEYVMGDLKEDSFYEIWNGPKYRTFRKSLMSGRKMIGICRNCTSGLRGVRY